MSTVSAVQNYKNIATSAKSNVLGKDDFLKMLIAQLKNQDPLNPLDGTGFVAQLAQFSSLEQLTNANTKLGSLGAHLLSLNNSQMINIIGKEVSVVGNTVMVDSSASNLKYELPNDARQVVIKIYDDQGGLVETLELGAQKSGLNSVTWNRGNMRKGVYQFEVQAIGHNGDQMPVNPLMTGIVTGITIKDGAPYLIVNGQEKSFSDVISIKTPQSKL